MNSRADVRKQYNDNVSLGRERLRILFIATDVKESFPLPFLSDVFLSSVILLLLFS